MIGSFTKKGLPALLAVPLTAALGSLLAGCDDNGALMSSEDSSASSKYEFKLPAHFPEPSIPDDNLLSVEKVKLGRQLFYDRRMSINEEGSCATCHEQRKAFTDGKKLPTGPTGDVHIRNAMSLTNTIYNSRQNWANPTLADLHQQAVSVMFNEDVLELGWADNEALILDRFRFAPDYPGLFSEAYPGTDDPFTVDNVAMAVSSFVTTLISSDSDFDRAQSDGNEGAMSDAARRGKELFNSERLECFHCHGAFNFAQSVQHTGTVLETIEFKNNGLYNIEGPGPGLPLPTGNYPTGNQGLYEFTNEPFDMGKFRAPTLRNIALTAPYMHDGSMATLREVIVDHYAKGGRLIPDGPFAGNGADSPYVDTLLFGFQVTDQEVDDLLAFFDSLTDWSFVCNTEYSDPFGTIPMHERCN